jgi:hypothetical protein
MVLVGVEKLDSVQLSIVSRLFSSAIISEMARKGKSPLFAKLIEEANLLHTKLSSEPIKNLFDEVFSLFTNKKAYKGFRQEYIYKSVLAHKILLGSHNLRVASILNEFRVGSCKADIVILNGTATVYEIKSDLDTLNRLEQQISEYRKVFASVNVITGENYIESVQKIVPEDVGILMLSNRYQISTIRKAIDSPERTIPEAIFHSIQLLEAKRILQRMGIAIPDLPNTQVHNALRKIFVTLDSIETHACMVEVLKETRSLLQLSDFVKEIPHSLQAATLFASIRKKDYERLRETLNTPIYEALNWS